MHVFCVCLLKLAVSNQGHLLLFLLVLSRVQFMIKSCQMTLTAYAEDLFYCFAFTERKGCLITQLCWVRSAKA